MPHSSTSKNTTVLKWKTLTKKQTYLFTFLPIFALESFSSYITQDIFFWLHGLFLLITCPVTEVVHVLLLSGISGCCLLYIYFMSSIIVTISKFPNNATIFSQNKRVEVFFFKVIKTLSIKLCHNACQFITADRWFSRDTLFFYSTNKTDCNNIIFLSN